MGKLTNRNKYDATIPTTDVASFAFNGLNNNTFNQTSLFCPSYQFSDYQQQQLRNQSLLSGGINYSSPSFSQTYSKPIMSAIEMTSISKFRYHRFRPATGFDDEERDRVVLRPKKWYRFRRIPIRKKFRLKFPSLRRLWRRKARLVSAMRKSYAKVKKRLKDGQVHFGDLFAGNYLFLQVNPTSLNHLEREMSLSKIA